VDIALAKISTEKGAALDTFYVNERDGQKILAPERQKYIEKSLRAALATLLAH
jgi:UTP:GlnB (protein PII) uridylyltransferase